MRAESEHRDQLVLLRYTYVSSDENVWKLQHTFYNFFKLNCQENILSIKHFKSSKIMKQKNCNCYKFWDTQLTLLTSEEYPVSSGCLASPNLKIKTLEMNKINYKLSKPTLKPQKESWYLFELTSRVQLSPSVTPESDSIIIV